MVQVAFDRSACDERLQRHALVGESTASQEVWDKVSLMGPSDAAVLIRGETGVGKDLVARALHDSSPRSGKLFNCINCAAIPDALFESELFGARRGAYTGATESGVGLYAASNGGTLFLDEIGELSLSAQSKLLRVLDQGTYRPIGETREFKANVRIVAATNRPLEAMVVDGSFREDLFHRLNVLTVHVPSLRERSSDIPLLVRHFLEQLAQPSTRISPTAMESLIQHDWRGNVRELKNTVHRTLVLNPSRWIDSFAISKSFEVPRRDPSDEDSLRAVLIETGGNLSRASRRLGIPRGTLRYRVRQLGLDQLVPRD